jgi:hypothetical protein
MGIVERFFASVWRGLEDKDTPFSLHLVGFYFILQGFEARLGWLVGSLVGWLDGKRNVYINPDPWVHDQEAHTHACIT